MDHFLEKCATIQLSWLEAGELVLKYEDLLTDDLSLLESALIDHCRLPITREALREAVLAMLRGADTVMKRIFRGRARTADFSDALLVECLKVLTPST